MNDREKTAALQNPPPSRNRHGKLLKNPGERSDGARRNIPQGDNERRGGRDRAEGRHMRARQHG